MNIGKKIKEIKRLKEIKYTIGLLKNECSIEYDNLVADDAIFKSGQRYAEMMIDILEYYKTKNPQVCDAVMLVINKYGKIDVRADWNKPAGDGLTYVIQLLIPEEVGLKIKGMHNKMKNDQKADQQEFLNKLDELAK